MFFKAIITLTVPFVSLFSYAQSDTIVNNYSYTVYKRYKNGATKLTGSSQNKKRKKKKSFFSIPRKNGTYIKYKKKGEIKNKKTYSFGVITEGKVFGLKQGWYPSGKDRGIRYFIGIPIQHERLQYRKNIGF